MLRDKLYQMIEEQVKIRSEYIEIFSLAMALQNYDKMEDSYKKAGKQVQDIKYNFAQVIIEVNQTEHPIRMYW